MILIWKRTHLIGLSTKLAEQTLKVIGSPNMAVIRGEQFLPEPWGCLECLADYQFGR
ncbi:hypothetical protein ACKFKF_20435 [Phormidesmis sp. 146-12]